MTAPIEIFCCYAREDQKLLKELIKHLKSLHRQRLITLWADIDIGAGSEWEKEIHKHLNTAHIILLLISSDFISSDYCYSIEMKRAIERHEREEARVIPVMLRTVYLHNEPFSKLQMLPQNGIPATDPSWTSLDTAFHNIVESISEVVEELNGKTTLPKYIPSRRTVVAGLAGTAMATLGAFALSQSHFFSFVYNNLFSWRIDKSPAKIIPRGTISPTPVNTSSVGTTLYPYLGHTAPIRALSWLPNNQRIASASNDYTAQIWNALTGGNRIVCQHTNYVEGVSWSPDNRCIVSGCADGTAQIWNAIQAESQPLFIYKGHILTYKGSARTQGHPWVNRVGWSPNGTYIVSCDQASDPMYAATAQVWNAKTGQTLTIYNKHHNGIYAVAWSPDGKHIASAGYDGTLQIWNAADGTTLATYAGNAFLFGLSWSPDNQYVAVGTSDNTILVLNSTSGYVINTFKGHYNWVKDVAWSYDGKYIASGGDDGLVMIWDIAKDTSIYTYNGHNGHINGVGWSSDGKYIASGGDTVKVWKA